MADGSDYRGGISPSAYNMYIVHIHIIRVLHFPLAAKLIKSHYRWACLPKKTNWYFDLIIEIIYHETNIIGFNFIISIKIEMTNNIKCRDKGPRLYIGPWTLAEDVDWSENE